MRTVLAALALAAAAAQAASAFSISDPATDGVARSLAHTQRWEIVDALDGLDYSIHDSICQDLRFVDGSSCDEVKAAIRGTFDLWASGHAYLRFNDRSTSHAILTASGESGVKELGVASMAAVARNGLDWRNKLSEDVIGFAHLMSVKRRHGGAAITEALISIDDKRCFYLDFDRINWDQQKSCPHGNNSTIAEAYSFRAVMAHEIGHAIGLDHPDLESGVHFDDDDIPDNPMHIDCTDPASTLRLSSNLPVYSVMNRSPDYPIERGLSHDDIAGRNFLYPACETGPAAFDYSPRLPLMTIIAIADEYGAESGAISLSSWDPVSSMRGAFDRCHEKYSVERCRFVANTRGWVHLATRADPPKAKQRPDFSRFKLAIGLGETEEAAETALRAECEEATPPRICLPVGMFAPKDLETTWTRSREDEDAADAAAAAAASLVAPSPGAPADPTTP